MDRLQEYEHIRKKAARWAADHFENLKKADPVLPNGFDNRLANNWRPLIAIACEIGGIWPALARDGAIELNFASTEVESIGSKLLQDIRDLFERLNATELSSQEIIDGLCVLENRPWVEINHGRRITPQWLAMQLKGYDGVEPKDIRFSDGRKLKGYHLDCFKEHFDRYLTGSNEPRQSRHVRQVNEEPALSS